jgi:hypothetical protein
MAQNVEGHRGRRGRWLVLAVLLAVAVWVVRSRRATRADYGGEWPLLEEAVPAVPAPPPAAEPAPRRPAPPPRPATTP